jgi:trans-aconitate 2-methyltransferase
MWDASQYCKFVDERARPFADLLAQVRCERPAFIVDLGCGTGHLTRTLAERWPTARVLGVDNSASMLEQARPLTLPGRLEFVQADIADWSCAQPIDLLVSNAALHWVGDHERLIPRLAALLAPGGTLAVQMPNRFQEPSQTAIEETAADARWATLLHGVGLHRESVLPLAWYVHQLLDVGFAVNAWETTYLHILTGDHPVLEWLKGTALRPLLQRLGPQLDGQFLADLGRRLRVAYPPIGGITVCPFPRLFFVATR